MRLFDRQPESFVVEARRPRQIADTERDEADSRIQVRPPIQATGVE
jgi:hypothetical protein